MLKIKKYLAIKRYKIDIWGLLKTTLSIRAKLLKHHYIVYDKLMINLKRVHKIKENFLKPMPAKFKMRQFVISKKLDKILLFFFNRHLDWIERKENRNQRYIYRIDLLDIPVRRKRRNYDFFAIQVIRLFYINLKYKNFRTMAWKAKKKDGGFGYNYMSLLEGRAACVIYRSSFIANMFDAINIAKLGLVWIFKNANKCYIEHENYVINVMEMVGFRGIIKSSIFWKWSIRAYRKALLSTAPKYMFVSYFFFYFFMKYMPKPKQIINPVNIDIYRLSGFTKYKH